MSLRGCSARAECCGQLVSGGDLRCPARVESCGVLPASAESCGVVLGRSRAVCCYCGVLRCAVTDSGQQSPRIPSPRRPNQAGCPTLVRLRLQALFFRLVDHWLPIERFLPLISNTRGIESTPALILACLSTCAFLFPRAAISNS